MNKQVNDHVSRCIEIYGQPIDTQNDVITTKTVERVDYEQMRADLMIAVGMLAALNGGRGDE